MKKVIKNILVFIVLIMVFSVTTYTPKAEENTMIFETVGDFIDEIEYGDQLIRVKKIIEKQSGKVAYCLDIDENYPSGQKFLDSGKASDLIAKVLDVGYPNQTAIELGVQSDDKAYFATQIVLWSITEGYDVNGFHTNDKNILKAIKKIYKDAVEKTSVPIDYEYRMFFANKNIQKVLNVRKFDSHIDEKGKK